MFCETIIEEVKLFYLDTVMLEMEKMILTLITILKDVVHSPSQNKPLIALITSQLKKARHQAGLGITSSTCHAV